MVNTGASLPRRHSTLRTEVREAKDNWLEEPDRAERRKLQNRLHQRAWRRKRKEGLSVQPRVDKFEGSWAGHGMLILKEPEAGDAAHPRRRAKSLPTSSSTSAASNERGASAPSLLIPPILSTDTETRILFPLSPDHLLLTLVQYNVKRAIMYNMALLGLSEALPPAKQSALLLPPLLIPSPPAFPTSLYPTSLQLSMVYDPRIAIVPCAAMRNNLIMFSGAYDMEALVSDLHGGLFEGFRDADMSGVMIWGEPWRSASWEVTDGFARKWGFLLEGCPDIQDATNRWRESRGEEPICWGSIPTLEISKTRALRGESCS